MKKNIFIILIVSLSSLQSFSQEIKEKKWVIKWNNTAAIDLFSFPTVQFAVERKLGSSFGIQTEAGIQLYDFNQYNADTLSVKNSGFRLMTEGRFYLFKYFKNDKTKHRKSDGVYTGLQVFYRKNSYNERNFYYLSDNSFDSSRTDDFGIKKEVYGWNLCFGYQIPIHNFIIEPYLYIGGLKRNIKNFNREYDKNLGHLTEEETHGLFIENNDLEEDSGKGGNFAFGLRLGYKF